MEDDELSPRARALLKELNPEPELVKPKKKPSPALKGLISYPRTVPSPSDLSEADLANLSWEKPSNSTPGKVYTIKYSQLPGGIWMLTCDCPIWIYNKRRHQGRPRTCRHTDEVEAEGYPNPFRG